MSASLLFRRFAACMAGLLMVFSAPASAWGFFAHVVTADIAEQNIDARTRSAMQQLFAAEALVGTPDCALSNIQEASVWPDCVRREFWRWGYTAAWHYRTAPICEPYNPRSNCAGGNCILAQIERSHRMLADEALPRHIRLEALAFLVHFAGDVHMPLHSGDKGDRGGNDRIASYGAASGLNLHWIWDGPLAERAITSAEPDLVRRYSAEERGELLGEAGQSDAAEWGRESWQLARDFVYPTAFDSDDVCSKTLPAETMLSQDDIERSLPIARRRVTQAGLRIAGLLDSAFAPGPLPLAEDEQP